MAKRFVHVGDKFERLTVVADSGKRNPKGEKMFLCRCDCGQEVVVRSSALGINTRSCGCIRNTNFKEGTYLPALKVDKKPQKNNTSGHVGVVKCGKNTWYAKIKLFGRYHYLGTFENYSDACSARCSAELDYFVPTAKTLGGNAFT